MLELNLIHVSKRGPCYFLEKFLRNNNAVITLYIISWGGPKPVPTYPSTIAHNRLALLIFSWKDDENDKLRINCL